MVRLDAAAVGRALEWSFRGLNLIILIFLFLDSFRYFFGIDIVKSITEAPPFDYKAIVAQYPGLFFGLTMTLFVLVMLDQTIVSRFYRGRILPPTGYALAINLATFALAITLIVFLRDAPMVGGLIWFAALSGIALVHIALIRIGALSEIKGELSEAGEEIRPEELIKRQTIYPAETYLHRGRRVLR
jgi:hypothetical protein